ncbi:hypothetical protein ACEV6Q_12635 [Enterobacter ludwigii]|uniref:hypothetical protein n=1 Tax=Enterobacter ludwigii TaxID=299767 RepID=UPI003BEED173
MGIISFELKASSVNINPVTRDCITVELDDVELSDLISAVDDNNAILNEIGAEEVATWITDNHELNNVLDNIHASDVAEWLEKNGYEVGESGS